MRQRWLWGLFIAVLAAPAAATTLARMSLARLTAAATAIVRARCLGASSDWEGGEIWTRTRFRTLETFKGAPPAEFTVRLLGGQVGGIESIVGDVPRFQPGEDMVLFLDPSQGDSFSVTAWIEGTFRVRHNPSGHVFVTQESAGEAVYDRATGLLRQQGIRDMPLDEFRLRIHILVSGAASGPRRSAPAPDEQERR
jgi:hypothetical protein